MKDAIPGASLRQICHLLKVGRSSLTERPSRKVEGKSDSDLEGKIEALIRSYPTYGYRRIRVMLKSEYGLNINRKKVQKLFQKNGWQVRKRDFKAKPRVRVSKSSVCESNLRWATDMTHIDCGKDGWGHLSGVIDCGDRELIGWEFALRGRSHEAVRALEDACIGRFGTLRPEGRAPILRSDNGLIFQSREYRASCKDYRIGQEFITPYTPEQNGIIERFFRSLKEECVWQKNFKSFEEARREIARWIEWYNHSRPHQALGYLSPKQYREQQRKVA